MKRNWLEWIILGFSVAVVVLLVGFLFYTGITNRGPAVIRAEVDAAGPAEGPDGGWLVPLNVRNEGSKVAASIVVEGTASISGKEESSQLTIDLLAADSTIDLVLGFSGQPEGEVRVRVVGFEQP
jgi:uncharacterized protein (TIGR02588 family)